MGPIKLRAMVNNPMRALDLEGSLQYIRREQVAAYTES